MATVYPENMFGDPLPPHDPDKPGHERQEMQRGAMSGREKRPSAVAGRKKCTTCGKLPKDMTGHWSAERESHGPISTENPEAVRNLPGMRDLSESMGALMFRDRRMR